MSLAFATERRLLAEDEIEPIRRSHYPLLEDLPREEVQDLARWLRARRDRARDLMRTHRRAKRGKSAAAPPLPDADRGLAAKKQVFAGALRRVNARLDALLGAERRAANLARLRQALARRQAAVPQHPAAGATRHAGTRSLPNRRSRPTIHGARIGSTSQAGRNAQARRDAR
ncbi:hypothetical protein [Roseicella aquatilis]|uniref:Uncharacterized protein n=1 Tax=Roseicella aquatilis TaxID=2527868 RepID=A0A4R4DRE4_9PROT|nr:hypothetical protein [Roseicella aquatilis]TCZ64839.1 hypothetical protein EXY23_05540 [Roseicella aquatilis]